MEKCNYERAWALKFLKVAYNRARKDKSLNVTLEGRRLIVDGKSYSNENIFHIPIEYNPLYIFTPTKYNKVVYYTSLSPLSNHFPSPFEIGGRWYNCMEQFFMREKALFFNDKNAESLILRTTNPVEQKAIGRRVKNFEKHQWEERVSRVLWKGLLAKFCQNRKCAEFLINTGNKRIFEANDRVYGVGVNLFDPRIWDERNHCGKNLMGRWLQLVRAYLLENCSCESTSTSVCTVEVMESSKTIEISPRKVANINEYKGISYIHFHDKTKGKHISFSSTEFKQLMGKKDEIEQCFVFLNRRRQKREEEEECGGGQQGKFSPVKGEKRYADPEEYYSTSGPPKQKQLRPSYNPSDYGDLPSTSSSTSGGLLDY